MHRSAAQIAPAPQRIRPLDPGDREALAALFERLSPASRHRRFLAPKPHLTERDLDRLAAVDHDRHAAFGYLDDDGALAGVARYATVSGATAAFAVEVADSHHGRGIATALAHCVLARARDRGFTRLVASTLWENHPARALLGRLGFTAYASAGGVVELELFL